MVPQHESSPPNPNYLGEAFEEKILSDIFSQPNNNCQPESEPN